MAKKKNDYFKLMEEQVSYCVKAAELLEEIIENFSLDTINDYRAKMHEIERAGDDIHHDIVTKLTSEFITPIDQEDILRLVQLIDNITDALDEVVQDFYMYHVTKVTPDAVQLSKIVKKCVTAFGSVVSEMKNFKKPEGLKKHIQTVNLTESDADFVYTEAMHQLFASDADYRSLITNRVIYMSLEACCDMCEDAADVVEQVIIKNT